MTGLRVVTIVLSGVLISIYGTDAAGPLVLDSVALNAAQTEQHLDLENKDVLIEPHNVQSEPTSASSKAHSRQKRFVYINTDTPTDIGFLIVVPYSFALPTFNLQTSRRRKKSITLENELLANLTMDEILPSESFDEPAYGIELSRLSIYFSVLRIDEDICQQKIICEVFSDPEKYQPLSNIIGKKLTADHGPVQENPNSRYYRYVKAMQEGISGGERACHKVFSRCPYSAKDRLNMQALHFWSFLQSILQMDFKDDHY